MLPGLNMDPRFRRDDYEVRTAFGGMTVGGPSFAGMTAPALAGMMAIRERAR